MSDTYAVFYEPTKSFVEFEDLDKLFTHIWGKQLSRLAFFKNGFLVDVKFHGVFLNSEIEKALSSAKVGYRRI